MQCPKCGSTAVSVQMVTDTQLQTAGRGVVWWLFIGCWWVPIKWMLFAGPALLIKIFAPKRYKLRQVHNSVCVCQSCGYHGSAAEFGPAVSPVEQESGAGALRAEVGMYACLAVEIACALALLSFAFRPAPSADVVLGLIVLAVLSAVGGFVLSGIACR